MPRKHAKAASRLAREGRIGVPLLWTQLLWTQNFGGKRSAFCSARLCLLSVYLFISFLFRISDEFRGLVGPVPLCRAARVDGPMQAGAPHAELETEASWTRTEDEAVLQCVAKFGLSSCTEDEAVLHCAARLPGRSEHSIRNRWLTLQDLRSRAGHLPPPHHLEPAPWIAPSPPTHWPADGHLMPTSFDGAGLNGGHHPSWQPVWVVSMVVPADWRPGRKLAMTLVDGGRVIITPPDDATPGMPLKCHVPASGPASMRAASPATYSREAEARTLPFSASSAWGAERPQLVELGPKSHLSNSETAGLERNCSLDRGRSPKRDAHHRDPVLSSVRSPPGILERPGGAFRATRGAGARARTLPAMEKSKAAALLGRNAKLVALSARAIAGDRDALCGAGHVPQVLPTRACPTCGLNRSCSMHSLQSMCTNCLKAARVQASAWRAPSGSTGRAPVEVLPLAVPGVRHPLLKPKAVSTLGLDVAGRARDAAVPMPWPVGADDPRRAQGAVARHYSASSGAPQTKRQRSEASPGTAGGRSRGEMQLAARPLGWPCRSGALRWVEDDGPRQCQPGHGLGGHVRNQCSVALSQS